MTLFTGDDLDNWLGKSVAPTRAQIVEKVVWGWLRPILGTTDRPNPVPDELFAWAVELGAIAHENPVGLSGKGVGPFSEQYSGLRDRRETILQEVRRWAADQGGTSATEPAGDFPPAERYPDPAW